MRGTPPGAEKECVLRIVYRGTAVATRLIVFLLKTLQVRIEVVIARKRLRRVKADFTALSIQPGGEFRN